MYEYVIFMYVCAPLVCLVLAEVRRSEEGNGRPETRGMDNCSYLSVNAPRHTSSLVSGPFCYCWICTGETADVRHNCLPFAILLLCIPGPSAVHTWLCSLLAGRPPHIRLLWGNYRFCWGKGGLFRRSRKVTEIGAGKGTCLFPRLAECRLPCWRAAIDARSTTGVLRWKAGW